MAYVQVTERSRGGIALVNDADATIVAVSLQQQGGQGRQTERTWELNQFLLPAKRDWSWFVISSSWAAFN